MQLKIKEIRYRLLSRCVHPQRYIYPDWPPYEYRYEKELNFNSIIEIYRNVEESYSLIYYAIENSTN